jgi:Zn-dependent protease
MVNLGFFVFNSIPIPPLDGSRVLYALAPEFVRRAMEAIEQFGVMFIFFIVLIANGAIGSFMSTIINTILEAFSAIFHLF